MATDKVSNRQATPTSGQATTLVDVTAPSSSVTALPSFSSASFTVSWSGSDGANGSGIASYSVYVSDNGSSFSLLLGNTTKTSTSFTGQDGHTYGFYSIATDKAGNTQPTPSAAQTTTTVDAQLPTSGLNALPPFTNSPSFTISYTASPAGNLAEVDIYVKGPTDSSYTKAHAFTGSGLGSGSFIYNASEGDGSYAFYSVATDKIGNSESTNSAQTSTLLDTAKPTSSATSQQHSNNTTFTVNYTASDPGSSASGLAEVDVYARGPSDSGYILAHAFTGASLSSGSFSYNASEGDGSYAFYSVATDKAGNVQATPSSANTTTLLDTAKPTSSASSSQYSNNTTFTVSYTASDPGSSPSGLAEVDVFAKGPSDSGYILAHAFTGASLSSGNFSYNANEGDGSYAFYSVATDKAGNVQATPSVANTSTLLDTARPTSSASSPTYRNNTTFTVGYTASDFGSSASGLAEVDVYVKGPSDSIYSLAHAFTGSNLGSGSFSYNGNEGDGNYSFYTIATDKAGNVQATPSIPNTITLLDTARPSSSASSSQYSSSTTFTVSYTANDPGISASGVAEVDVYVKGPKPTDSYILAHAFTGTNLSGGNFSYNANEGDGSYAFYSIATDNAGNVQSTPGVANTASLLDTATPTSTASSPQYSNSTTFTVSYTANDPGSSASGLSEVDVYVKGPNDNGYILAHAFTGSSLSTGNFSYNANEGDGAYAFYSIAIDKADNIQAAPSIANTSTLLDSAKPTFSISSPPYSDSKIFTVSYMASDPGSNPSGLAEVDIYVKGPSDSGSILAHVFTGSSLSTGSFSYTASEGDGSYSFYGVATDKAGNTLNASNAQTSTLVDTVKPISVASSPTASTSSTFTVSYTASDPGSSASGLAEVDLYVKGPSDSVYNLAHVFTGSSLSTGSFSYTASEGDGSYAFYTNAKDNAGNAETNNSAQTSTLVDTTPPTSSASSPPYSNNTTFTVSYNASDSGSGLAEVDVFVKGPIDSGYSLAHAFTGFSLSTGNFGYNAHEGDGAYAFYSIAIDKDGNVQPTPTVPNTSTLLDTAAPTSSASSPQYSNSKTFTVGYTASDPGSNPSGVSEVDVYVKGPTDSSYIKTHAFTGASLSSGNFIYIASEGDGNYGCYTIATDKAGNVQTTPSTPNTSTLLDTATPTSSASSPQYSNSTTFTVSYTASDPGSSASGLTKVDLYVKGPTDGVFSPASSSTGSSLGSGNFSFKANEGDGSYAFYTIATDKAGNVQLTPSVAQTVTLVDTTPPTSIVSSPTTSNSTTFTVSYTASDPGSNPSGVGEVDVFVKGPSDVSYTKTHAFTGSSLSSGNFIYIASEGDGNYAFYSIATDKAGNVQATPSCASVDHPCPDRHSPGGDHAAAEQRHGRRRVRSDCRGRELQQRCRSLLRRQRDAYREQ